jgi:hypothetical protein
MTVPSPPLPARLQTLAQLFSLGELDVPDGLFDRHCTFRLNGRAAEELLGRSPSDPLARLLGRGPGGYRLVAQQVRYAVPDAVVFFEDVLVAGEPRGLATCVLRLQGTPRDGSSALDIAAAVALVLDADHLVVEAGIQVADDVVRRIRAAQGA